MDLPDVLAPLIGQSGFFGLLAWIGYKMHLDAIRTHDKRATEWMEAARREQARADLKDQQLAHVLSPIRELTTGSGS